MTRRDWRDGVLLGAALGAIVLGLGGRIAMRVIALANQQDLVLTLAGTMTVVTSAAIAGAVGGAILLVSRWAGAYSRVVGEIVFWGLSLALAFGILSPVNRLRLELFLPLTALYAALLRLLWRRCATRVSPSSTAA